MRATLALILLVGLVPRGAVAQETAISGTVVDGKQQAIPGATAWLLDVYSEKAPKAQTTTDAQGRFSFGGFARGKEQFQVLVRDTKGQIGWVASPDKDGKVQALQVVIPDAPEVRGRVLDLAGAPIAKARITPERISRGKRGPLRDSLLLFPEVAKELAVQTAEDGSFVLRNLPHESIVVNISAEAFGTPRVFWEFQKTVTVHLDRAGAIRGILTCAQDPNAAVGVRLSLRRQIERDPTGVGPVVSYFGDTRSGNGGAFRFDGLPPGKYAITPELDSKTPFVTDPTPWFDVKPDAEAKAPAIVLNPAITIRGKVIDHATGKGIKDIGVQLYQITPQNSLSFRGSDKTDAEGRYKIFGRSERIMVELSQLPDDYLALPEADRPRADATSDSELPDIKLRRAPLLAGIVVDTKGKPVSGAEVFLPRSERWDKLHAAVSDMAGRFNLKKVDPDDTTALRARTDRATTDGAKVVVPSELKDPVQLVLAETNAFRIRGSVTDEKGQAIPSVAVSVWWHRAIVSKRETGRSVSSRLEEVRAGPDGSFQTSVLWPGDRYYLIVSAEGHGKAQSAEVLGKVGEVHDVGRLSLMRADAVVRGQVVDSANRPVAGAKVFNSGDALQLVAARTDDDGRFRLAGLFGGPVYVFAEKSGFRFTGKRVTGGSDIKIQLLKPEEVRPSEKPAADKIRAERKDLARKFLERLWTLPPKQRSESVSSILEHMAHLDPAQALRWADEAGGRHPQWTRLYVAEALAETDPNETLALLAVQPAAHVEPVLHTLALRYLKSDPARALRFAEEGVLRARTIDQPNRSWALARLGTIVRRLGKEEAGRRLIEEAAAAVEKMGVDGMQGYARGRVAADLAPIDAKRALALLQPVKEPDRTDHLGHVAVALCTHDLPKALELVDTIHKTARGGNYTADGLRRRMAYELAANQPAKAIEVVEGMVGGWQHFRAEGFAWVAVAVSKSDPKTAWSLIDRGLAVVAKNPQAATSSSGAEVALAGHIAGLARDIGYPDTESLVYRVLALRPTGEGYSPGHDAESLVSTAMTLARADRLAAKNILETVETRSEAKLKDRNTMLHRNWLIAWTLTDPTRATELFDKELTRLTENPKAKLGESSLLDMLDALLLTPEDRRHHYARAFSRYWFPGRD